MLLATHSRRRESFLLPVALQEVVTEKNTRAMADRMLGRLVHHVLLARLYLTFPMLEPDSGSALVPVDLEPARMVVDRVYILTLKSLILKEPANHDVLVLVAHIVVDLLCDRAGVRGHQVTVLVGG